MLRLATLLVVLLGVCHLLGDDPPTRPVGDLWKGGKWPPDGKEYPAGSFRWIKQADWDKYERDMLTWKASQPRINDAMVAVNAARAKRGLPPYIEDPALSVAASNAASYRASRRIAGHTNNDFAYLPSGSSAKAAGCAAWDPSMGWGSCCAYENWTYAGAGWAMGSDGKRYMHLFVR